MALTAEEIGKLAQTLPGTVGGELLRRHWFPLAPVAELTDDNPIQAIRMLSAGFVLFRNRAGQVGLIQERCTHHGVLLYYGTVDDNSLICPRHGWQFDVEGHCYLGGYQGKPFMMTWGNAKSYAVAEQGGLYWGYLGPQPAPPPPDHPLLTATGHRRLTIGPVVAENWLRLREEQLDLPAWQEGALPHPTLFTAPDGDLVAQRPLDDDYVWQVTIAVDPGAPDGVEIIHLDAPAPRPVGGQEAAELWYHLPGSST